MLRKLLPREHRFFELFEQQSAVIKSGLDLFDKLLKDYSQLQTLAKHIKDAENEADHIAHQIFSLLNNTFVTPFDREDIQLFVNRMDDVIDHVEEVSARMVIFGLPKPPEGVGEMIRILKEAFGKLASAVSMLKNWKNREPILQICVEVNRLENDGDAVLRESLERLFREPSDPFYVIKVKEIYESLEDAIDRCEDLANVIETILIKNS